MQQEPQKRVADADQLLKELTAIHRKLTGKSPEEIMAQVMAAKTGRKVVLGVRHRFPWKIAAVLCVGAALAAATYRFGVPAYRQYRAGKAREEIGPYAVAMAMTAGTQPARSPDSGDYLAVHNVKEQKPGLSAEVSAIRKTRGAPALQAAVKAAQNPPPQKPLEVSLAEKYGASDPLEIMQKELGSKNYINVLNLYNGLPVNVAKSGQAIILKMHALEGAGNNAALTEFFHGTSLNDAELYLAKAKLAFRTRDYAGCRKLLDQCLSSPHAFTEYDILKREAYYYTAQCATALFDNDPNEQTYKNALDAWWQLRSALRSDPLHEYNKKAGDELQRMAKKMQKG
jgi:hypothetical protein